MDIRQYVGKRCLLKVASGGWSAHAPIDEFRIIEVSPSGQWVKRQNLHGNKFWRAVTEVGFVEELRDFKAERRALET